MKPALIPLSHWSWWTQVTQFSFGKDSTNDCISGHQRDVKLCFEPTTSWFSFNDRTSELLNPMRVTWIAAYSQVIMLCPKTLKTQNPVLEPRHFCFKFSSYSTQPLELERINNYFRGKIQLTTGYQVIKEMSNSWFHFKAHTAEGLNLMCDDKMTAYSKFIVYKNIKNTECCVWIQNLSVWVLHSFHWATEKILSVRYIHLLTLYLGHKRNVSNCCKHCQSLTNPFCWKLCGKWIIV